jgi:hypothetical protein
MFVLRCHKRRVSNINLGSAVRQATKAMCCFHNTHTDMGFRFAGPSDEQHAS